MRTLDGIVCDQLSSNVDIAERVNSLKIPEDAVTDEDIRNLIVFYANVCRGGSKAERVVKRHFNKLPQPIIQRMVAITKSASHAAFHGGPHEFWLMPPAPPARMTLEFIGWKVEDSNLVEQVITG